MRITHYTYPLAHSLLNRVAPALTRMTPFALEAQIERLLGASACAFEDAPTRFPIDLYEDKSNTYVRAELPGVPRSAITIEAVDGVLEIVAAQRKENETQDSQTTLKRSVQIPENTQIDKISAAHEDGVLTITLPKREQPAPQKFTVQIN